MAAAAAKPRCPQAEIIAACLCMNAPAARLGQPQGMQQTERARAQVTGLAVSPNHPYVFSCGLDKMVKCWDMEYNKVIRQYHGHLSGVYSLSLNPDLSLVLTGAPQAMRRQDSAAGPGLVGTGCALCSNPWRLI